VTANGLFNSICIGIMLGCSAAACTRWKTVTVPIRVVEPCLKELGPPPPIPDLDVNNVGPIISALEDQRLWALRAWGRCSGGG
jgi:hypothetical protein